MMGLNWADKEEVFDACMLGDMARLLISAMEWESEYETYKKKHRKKVI